MSTNGVLYLSSVISVENIMSMSFNVVKESRGVTSCILSDGPLCGFPGIRLR